MRSSTLPHTHEAAEVREEVKTFDEAATSAAREALLRAGSLANLSAHTNVRIAFLTAYVSGMTVATEEHLRAINDYLKRTI